MNWRSYRIRRCLKGLAIGVFVGLFGIGLAFSPWGSELEARVGLPALYAMRGAVEAPQNVIVAAINEDVAEALELPADPADWPRTIHARLIDGLVRSGAAVIVFDMYFETPKTPEDDSRFADAIAGAGRVVLFERIDDDADARTSPDGPSFITRTERLVPPLAVLASAAEGMGPSALPRDDGDYNRYWTFKASVGDLPTMPAVALQIYTRPLADQWLEVVERVGVRPDARGSSESAAQSPAARTIATMRGLRSALRSDPQLAAEITEEIGRDPGLDATARQSLTALTSVYAGDEARWLKFFGPSWTIRTITIDQLLAPEDPNTDWAPMDLSGAAVFVGYSDPLEIDVPDTFATVYTENAVELSGVEIVATAFANLLNDSSLSSVRLSTEIVSLLALGILFGVLAYLVRAPVGVPLVFASAAAYTFIALQAFTAEDLWMPLATPVLGQMPLALLAGLLGQYKFLSEQVTVVMANLRQYIPDDVVVELTQREFELNSLNREFHATCLATDMSGSVTIAANMSPSDFGVLMNEYFEALGKRLEAHGVNYTEFRADGIMCAWDSSKNDDEVRAQAVWAGLEVVESIDEFCATHESLHLHARVGLAGGPVKLGHPPSGGRLAYTIVGDCANTTARIESLNKTLGTHMLASESVVEGLDGLLVRPLGRFLLKGRPDATSVAEVVARRQDALETDREMCARFAEALYVFEQKRWADAAALFLALSTTCPGDGPTRLYLDACQRLRVSPPDSTDSADSNDHPDSTDPTVIHV